MTVGQTPRATLRLQLHGEFGFDAAREQLPYFAALGISHLFVSPILTARAGSRHGYDVVDHAAVNPELGGEPALRRLVAALREREMGLIVDVVPNHMAVGGADNARWLDVLEWGRDSVNGEFFDIDWEVEDPLLRHRVLLPLLGAQYGEALRSGEIALRYDGGQGRFSAWYGPHRLPLAPRSYALLLRGGGPALSALAPHFAQAQRPGSLGARRQAFAATCAGLRESGDDASISALLGQYDGREGEGALRLHRLLEAQHYRLAWWRTAADEINYRRFFDINELAGLRMDQPAVFESVHACIFRLYAEGLLDGLRIDHVDGLADPRGYCRRLRARLRQLATQRPDHAPRGPAYLVVEKILAPGEKLARDWQLDGSSGYSFMNEVGAFSHDGGSEPALAWLWSERGGLVDFAAEERRARRAVAQDLFAGDFNASARALHRTARARLETRDWTLAAVRRVLLEMLVHFPVYRTYADVRGRSAADVAIMAQVLAAATQGVRPAERELLARVDAWLLGEKLPAQGPQRRLRLRALARFQQLTSPVAAKAVEDTAFYRHGRLLSRNEVGSHPDRFAMSGAEFHLACSERLQRYPQTLLATATHDHKRGEDLRMRLAALSEMSEAWAQAVSAWDQHTQYLGTPPDAGERYMLFQMLVGAWPATLRHDDAPGVALLCERLGAWQRKALREARRHSSWSAPDEGYEQACGRFLQALLDVQHSATFLQSLQDFVATLAPVAAVKSLTQTLLRCTVPGVPDLYQGTELWDLSLVDPDNRRDVDFALRAQLLADAGGDERLFGDWCSGALKQALIQRCLQLRGRLPALFAHGDYRPLPLTGLQAQRVLAFARVYGSQVLLVLVPQLPAALMPQAGAPRIVPAAWGDTALHLSGVLRRRRWHDALSGRQRRFESRVFLRELLDRWPMALLSSDDPLAGAATTQAPSGHSATGRASATINHAQAAVAPTAAASAAGVAAAPAAPP